MNKTIRLFDQNAFIKEFEASVLSCQQEGGRFAVTLDKTAFFPESGGQLADKGTLAGIPVLDVQEKEGIIYHYLAKAVSGTVEAVLDWNTRFERMQNHSGEHVVSGLIHRHTGADNISFSLTDTETTLAFNVPLEESLLKQVEREANAAVFENVPIRAFYPDATALAAMDYRSKLALTENVRIVEVEGYDRCACCAPHCSSTGQIGLIKIIGSESYKGGTKLWIVCGNRALAHYGMLLEQGREISHLLCAKTEKIASAVEKLKTAKEEAEYQLVSCKRKAIADAVERVPESAGDYLTLCDFEGDDLRLFAEALKGKIDGIVVVLAGSETGGYRYVITSKTKEIAAIVQKANAALKGRGGGRDNMARGSFAANLKEISVFFKNREEV